MARSSAVWGVDIGNCSLKALRCSFDKETGTLTADAFDYIEYPKILTQPDMDPGDDLVHDALQQFLSRNSIKGDKIAISVASLNGLTRFIKLPPVEPKRIPSLVKYEAKQQIPFDLKDVIWDYRRLGAEEQSDFAMDLEIGLFAMKRELVYKSLEPFDTVKMPIDYVQLTSMAMYNLAKFDLLKDIPAADEYDPENPPPYTVLLTMGTDATDVVVTNGYRVWWRSIPIGGNHFTKALTTEMKLTFSKAEHLKRNANASNDKKALFQAMRPVFSDFVDALQRSLQYFVSLDRFAKIDNIIGMGNPMLLAGLRKYLEQQMGMPVSIVEKFNKLNTSELETNPLFKDNLTTFGTCYALCVNALGKSALNINLLPREIVHARIINSKKPWAVAASALIMLGCSISLGMHHINAQTAENPAFKTWESQAQQLSSQASSFETATTTAVTDFGAIQKVGGELLSNAEYRSQWLELIKLINSTLPSDPQPKAADNQAAGAAGEGAETPETPIPQRNEIHIVNIEAQPLTKLALWKSYMEKSKFLEPAAGASEAAEDGTEETDGSEEAAEDTDTETTDAAATEAETEADTDSSADESSDEDGEEGPQISFTRKKEQYLVQITAYHYHNTLGDISVNPEGAEYVRQTVLKALREGTIDMPRSAMFDFQAKQKLDAQAAKKQSDAAESEEAETTADSGSEAEDGSDEETFRVFTAPGESKDKDTITYTMEEMGIQYPVLINELGTIREVEVENPFATPETATPAAGPMEAGRMGAPMPAVVQPAARTQLDADGKELDSDKNVTLNRFDFVIQFVWTPQTPMEREQARQAKLKAAYEAEKKAAEEKAAKEAEEKANEDAEDEDAEDESEDEAENEAEETN